MDVMVLADDEFKEWFNNKLGELKPMMEKQVKTGEMLPPALLVFGLHDQVAIVPTSLNTIDEKHAATKLQQLVAADTTRCAGCMIISETWHITRKEKPKPGEIRQSLEHHPDRQESVMITCMRGVAQLMAIFIIDRETGTLRTPMIMDVHDATTPAQGNMIPGSKPQGATH